MSSVSSGRYEGKGRPVSDEELDKIRDDLAEQDARDASKPHSSLIETVRRGFPQQSGGPGGGVLWHYPLHERVTEALVALDSLEEQYGTLVNAALAAEGAAVATEINNETHICVPMGTWLGVVDFLDRHGYLGGVSSPAKRPT